MDRSSQSSAPNLDKQRGCRWGCATLSCGLHLMGMLGDYVINIGVSLSGLQYAGVVQ